MADRMTAAELAAVGPRIVGDIAAPAVVPMHEQLAAAQLARDIAAGDPGPVRAQLAALRSGTSAWQVEPWRLLGELAELQIRQQAVGTPA